MKKRFHIGLTVLMVLAFSLISSCVTAVFATDYFSHKQFQILGSICDEIMKEEPAAGKTVLKVLKAHNNKPAPKDKDNILLTFGYHRSGFSGASHNYIVYPGIIGFVLGAFLFLASFFIWHKKQTGAIQALTEYLEKVNTGRQGTLLAVSEDDFSKLQDEIYKTVTNLYQTRDEALKSRNNYADNLSNIAHQLKTPITAISLSVQIMKEQPSPKYLGQIQKQLSRLTHLEEALLLLSRIDAGTLTLEPAPVDVFTLLNLACDNLQELFREAGVTAVLPDMGEIKINADLDWTMEAFMNLFKNCIEHTPKGGLVHCSYEANPLYVQIRIWDEGEGFAKEDIPHIFERFYRGKNGKDGGIGIGLSLARALLEMQNGMISAVNLPQQGACFEIRFYSHLDVT